MTNSRLRPTLSDSRPKKSAPTTSPIRYTVAMSPAWVEESPSVSGWVSLSTTALATVISSPSRIQATPSAITMRVWNGDQGNRSIRAGMRLRMPPGACASDAVVMESSWVDGLTGLPRPQAIDACNDRASPDRGMGPKGRTTTGRAQHGGPRLKSVTPLPMTRSTERPDRPDPECQDTAGPARSAGTRRWRTQMRRRTSQLTNTTAPEQMPRDVEAVEAVINQLDRGIASDAHGHEVITETLVGELELGFGAAWLPTDDGAFELRRSSGPLAA